MEWNIQECSESFIDILTLKTAMHGQPSYSILIQIREM